MVLFIGEILADVMMNESTGSMQAYLGGAPYNAAVSCAAGGAEAVFLGRVGDDPVGRFVRRQTEKYPVKSVLQVDPTRPTTIAFVSLDEKGERDFCFLRHDAADAFVMTDDVWDRFRPDVVHLGSLMLSEEAGRKTADCIVREGKKRGVTISFDVNLREDIFRDKREALAAYKPLLDQADVVKFGEEEVEYFFGKGYETALYEMKNALVAVTLGKEGCVVKYGNTTIKVPSRPVTPVDTTGAGDAFYGAFLAGIDGKDLKKLTKDDLIAAATKACEAGREATLYKGALRV